MKKYKGIYINLRESKERDNAFKKQLKVLNISNIYERFEAIKGDEEKARLRNLNSGEFGLWKSWISILKNETINRDTYQFLHIAEDDAKLSWEFVQLMNTIQDQDNWDLLATDMYVNRSIFKAWSEQHMKLIKEQNAQ